MIKLNRDYSDYTDLEDEKYPNGKAIDCSTDESYDGTPIKKELINDLHGALEAVVKEAEGDISGVSGQPDNIEESDFKNAIKKLIDTPLNDHISKRGPDAHGATVAATPGQIITRDDNGRAQVADPAADSDIANKGWVMGLRQLFFDVSHPVGDIFVQYPSIGDFITKTPQQLFNVGGVSSTWVEVDYGGAFFRSNGGLSETFGSQSVAQKAELPNVRGTDAEIQLTGNGGFTNTMRGAFQEKKKSGGIASTYVAGGTSALNFSASTGQTNADGTTYVSQNDSVYRDGGEVRPANFTVRVWRRTA